MQPAFGAAAPAGAALGAAQTHVLGTTAFLSRRRAPRARPSAGRTRASARAPTAPAATGATATTQHAPPTRTPYPPPAGVPAERAALVPPSDSIPHLMQAVCADPALRALPALVDEHHGEPVTLTYGALAAQTARFAAGLARLGMRRGEVVSLFSENSYRWCVADHAIMTVGAAAAVRGVAAPVGELLYILRHSDSQYLFVEDAGVLAGLVDAGLDVATLKFVVLLFGSPAAVKTGVPVYTYAEVLSRGENPTAEETTPQASRSDIATLLYTSGTTGNPKGVILTHDNILSQLADISVGHMDPVPGEVFVSVLPCWHVFERTAEYWTLSKGMKLVYSNKRRFRDDLAAHKPHMLISVPRVFENLHAAIMGKLEKASALRRALFGFFMAVSLAFVKARRRLRHQDLTPARKGPVGSVLDVLQMSLLLPLYALANALLWKKIRAGMGGRLRACLSGGGTIPGYLEDFYECVGIVIMVGYGMTETSPVIANRFGEHNVRGSTGMNLPRAYVKIVDTETGEIVPKGQQGTLFVGGPYVFAGYLKNPEATAKCFDKDGYFDTGDLAYFGEQGDLVITGRSKDMIVLTNGENIEPAAIEDALLASPTVDQVMLVGQDERALGALVVPKLDYLVLEGVVDSAFEEKVHMLLRDEEANAAELRKLEVELQSNPQFAGVLNEEVKSRNRGRSNYTANDRISHIRVVLVPFTVENGMLTQTLKIKKNVVTDVFSAEIAEMYRK